MLFVLYSLQFLRRSTFTLPWDRVIWIVHEIFYKRKMLSWTCVFHSICFVELLKKKLLRCHSKALERILDVPSDCSDLRLVILTFEFFPRGFSLKLREMLQGQAEVKHKVLCQHVLVDGARSQSDPEFPQLQEHLWTMRKNCRFPGPDIWHKLWS